MNTQPSDLESDALPLRHGVVSVKTLSKYAPQSHAFFHIIKDQQIAYFATNLYILIVFSSMASLSLKLRLKDMAYIGNVPGIHCHAKLRYQLPFHECENFREKMHRAKKQSFQFGSCRFLSLVALPIISSETKISIFVRKIHFFAS